MVITLKIKDNYVEAFMALIKKLHYVEINNMTNEKTLDNKAEAWKRVAEDEEMIFLANEGVADYKQTLDNYETN